MGQVAIARSPKTLTAVLGSCVGLALYHPRLKLGGLAHVVLPLSNGSSAQPPGKYADTALEFLLRQLGSQGAQARELIAKVAGGACMFASAGPLQIGEENVRVTLRLLQAAGIPISTQDLGGTKGRRITFDLSNGQMIIQSVNQAPLVI